VHSAGSPRFQASAARVPEMPIQTCDDETRPATQPAIPRFAKAEDFFFSFYDSWDSAFVQYSLPAYAGNDN
jgi:hypothetical protein